VRCWGGIILVLTALVVGVAGSVTATPEAATSATEDTSWLTRTLHRYFENSTPTGVELRGRSVQMVDRYAEHVGKPIEVVIVSQVARFDRDWDRGQGSGQQFLNSAAKPFQSYTKDSTIRQHLLFAQGQLVDPFLIADTERILRGLDFIEDVRIILVPLAGEAESVAVVVETRDRWPFGVAGEVPDVGRYEFSLYSSNVGGIGLRWENKLLYRDDREPNVGYQGSLRKENLAGTFVRGEVAFEDSYRKLNKGVALTRELSHPTIKWVGGASWHRLRERDAGHEPEEFEIGDVWLGDVIQLEGDPVPNMTARPVLVPALRFNRKTFLDRPVVDRETNRSFHNAQNYLVGVTYQRFKYYKTSYLFEMGETENLPSGLVLKLSGGYQDGEYLDRVQGFFQSSYFTTRNRGDVAFVRADIGGFYRNGVYEDGSLVLRGGYVTPLLGHIGWQARFFSVLTYHRAINRDSETALTLGNATSLRGMQDNRVLGNQRLFGNFEYRLFMPWSVMGFRFMLLGFLDVGAIAGEKDPILQAKQYASAGVAVRIQNPDLVLPALQMRVAFLNSIDDKGIQVGVKIGGPDSPEILVPGTRPGGFEFR